jgi:hypothetical protein
MEFIINTATSTTTLEINVERISLEKARKSEDYNSTLPVILEIQIQLMRENNALIQNSFPVFLSFSF